MNEVVSVKYILYADDDEDDREFMEDLLSHVAPDIGLVIKNNGENVVQFLEQLSPGELKPTLIILDLNMPGWDGIQTLREIKVNEQFNDIPIIIFTTTSYEIDREKALAAGATAFVTKPSSYKELEIIIKSFTAYF